jgi:hypothetical protein
MSSTPKGRPRTSSRMAQSACARTLKQLTDDHRCVKTAYREFQSLGADKESEASDAIVQTVPKIPPEQGSTGNRQRAELSRAAAARGD